MPREHDITSPDLCWVLRALDRGPGDSGVLLIHAPTGREMLDLRDAAYVVQSYRFSADPPLLHLVVRRADFAISAMPVTIDLHTGLFYHHPSPREGRPKGDVTDLVESLAKAAPPPERDFKSFTPRWIERAKLDWQGRGVQDVRSACGRFLLDLTTHTYLDGEFIHPARLVERATGRVLLDLRATTWDVRGAFEPDGRLFLTLRRAGANCAGRFVRIDPQQGVYWEGNRARSAAASGTLEALQADLGMNAAELREAGVAFDAGRDSSRAPLPLLQTGSGSGRLESDDGKMRIEIQSFRLPDGRGAQRLRVSETNGRRIYFELISDWRFEASFCAGSTALDARISHPAEKRALDVRIEPELGRYWERGGTEASGTQGGRISDLAARFTPFKSAQPRRAQIEAQAPDGSRKVLRFTPAGPDPVAQLLDEALDLPLPRDTIYTLQIAAAVSAGKYTPAQGAAHLRNWHEQ